MTVLASCKKLEEIKFSGPFFNALPFVTVLPNFISLKILNLQHQEFSDKETAEIFGMFTEQCLLLTLYSLSLQNSSILHEISRIIICITCPCSLEGTVLLNFYLSNALIALDVIQNDVLSDSFLRIHICYSTMQFHCQLPFQIC